MDVDLHCFGLHHDHGAQPFLRRPRPRHQHYQHDDDELRVHGHRDSDMGGHRLFPGLWQQRSLHWKSGLCLPDEPGHEHVGGNKPARVMLRLLPDGFCDPVLRDYLGLARRAHELQFLCSNAGSLGCPRPRPAFWAADGWIRTLGALDFAGGTVIHISAGVSGYVASAIVGPRRNAAQELGPANVPFVLLGASLMWFGWLGFAGGSALSAKNGLAPRAVTATLTAAASSMLSWIVMERMVQGKASSVGAAIGAVVGLICISPGAGYVTPGCSMAFGAIGGPWCYLCVAVFNRMSIDDTLDSMGLHGMGGIAGSILTGVFAMKHGLIYEGTFTLLGKQMAGILAAVAFSAVGTAAIVLCIKIFMPLRVTEEREVTGVDEEHTRGAMFKHKASAPPSSNDLEDCDTDSSDSLDPV
eukprot:s2534_g1.t1